MPIFNIRQIGSMGVISDMAPWDLPEGALSDGRNFRVVSGKVQASGGSKKMTDGSNTNELGRIDQITGFNGEINWFAMGDKAIQKFDGTHLTDVVSGLSVNPDLWTSCKIGRVMYFNHPEIGPYYWSSEDDITPVPQKLDWKPGMDWETAGVKCKVMTSHKNFVFAMNTTEVVGDNTEYLQDRVRWSHPVEPNGRPYTWEPANDDDRSSLAGYVTLGRGGEVVGAESLRDSLIIYSKEAVNVLDYTGDQLLWRRRTVSQAAGLIGKDAVTSIKGNHYFMAADDIILFDGNRAESLLHNRLRKKYANAIDLPHLEKSFTLHNAAYNEIWFCFPEKGCDFATVAYVFNYRDGTFAIRDLSAPKADRSQQIQFRSATYGQYVGSDVTWDEMTTAYQDERSTWRLSGNSAFNGAVLGCAGSDIYSIDTQEPDEEMETFIERTHIPVSGHDTVNTVTRVYPQIEGSAPVEVRVGSHTAAGDGVNWSKPNTFSPVEDRKIDSRATGELHAFRMDGESKSNFSITGLDVEFVGAGKR